jgi:hypothetical protein
MGLALRVLGFAGTTLLRIALVVLALFLGHLLLTRALPELQETTRALDRRPLVERDLAAVEDLLKREQESARDFERRLGEQSRSALRELSARANDWERLIEDLETQRGNVQQQIDAAKRERDEACDSWNPVDWWVCRRLEERFKALSDRLEASAAALEAEAKTARASLEKLENELRILEDPALDDGEKLRRLGFDDGTGSLSLATSRKRIETAQRDAAALRTELERLATLEASPMGVLVREWQSVRFTLLGIAVLVLALPYLQRVLNYFVLMPLVSRLGASLRLSETNAGTVTIGTAQRSLALKLGTGEHASVRSEYARPVKGPVNSRLLYRLSAPFISYAAGLRLLTHVPANRDEPVELTLAAPEDPNAYLMRLDLESHPGFVIHPRHLVGVVGDLALETRWRLFSVHAWATWQLRYILFSGTGSLVVEGLGDVVATTPGESAPTKIEQKLVVGFDSRLFCTATRTEVFWPYLFGKTPLVDDGFRGKGPFLWQKSNTTRSRNPVARSFDALFSALGKLLGF